MLKKHFNKMHGKTNLANRTKTWAGFSTLDMTEWYVVHFSILPSVFVVKFFKAKMAATAPCDSQYCN
jgi:hypothetical protein